MRKLTKYGRRIKLIFACAAVVMGTCIMISVPWSEGFAKADEDYYTVMVNGKQVGNVAGVSQAEDAFAKARVRLESENSGAVYVDSSMSVVENHAVIGSYDGEDVLEDRIYKELSKSLVEADSSAYVIHVGDTSVAVASLEEVSEVVNIVKASYDDEDKYEAVITESEDSRFETATCELVQAGIEPENRPIVMASEDGGQSVQSTEDTLSFGNEIQVIETYSADVETVSVEEAVNTIRSVLEVVTVAREDYTEAIGFSTEYIYEDSQYTDYSEMIQEGQDGVRNVTAEITYCNGIEAERTVLSSEVVAEPVSQIIKVGTMERPEYALPLANPVISDVYGPRWGRMHWGMDFSCRTGTDVLASAAGTVSEATYRSDYGYTVVINHGNGMQTRYAHMSQLLVNNGDSVNQGDVVGLSGNTGDSTGPHLHFEIIDSGYRVDPETYLYK